VSFFSIRMYLLIVYTTSCGGCETAIMVLLLVLPNNCCVCTMTLLVDTSVIQQVSLREWQRQNCAFITCKHIKTTKIRCFQHFALTNDGKQNICRCSTEGDEKTPYDFILGADQTKHGHLYIKS